VTALKQQKARLEGELAEIRRKLTTQIEESMRERDRETREARLALLRRKVTEKVNEEKVLDDDLARQEAPETPEYRKKLSEVKALETVRNNLQTTLTRIELDGNEVPWVLAQAPAVPRSRDHSTQIKLVGLGTVAVLGCLLLGIALLEFRSRRVHSPDDVTGGLGIPTVGTLPYVGGRTALTRKNARDAASQARLTESVDALRTLLMRSLGEGPHVVLVTSAAEGEGKTSLAGQLAASLARAWRKTLLVDGDLRKPAAHQLFDLPGEPGLSEVLRGEAELSDVVKPTAVSRLSLIPAGQYDAHALEALAQEQVGNLFAQIKDEFDFVVVDSSPVLPVTDALMLGQHVDVVLLSVLRGTSRLPTVYAARQRLAALDIPVLGAVVAGGQSMLGGLDIQYPRPASA
jgi:capsular exopolysaccharide synthesis family protein